MARFEFPHIAPTEAEIALRAEVRAFLADERAAGTFRPRPDCWVSGISPEFSQKLGSRGWLGMVWPKKYGGHERSALERLVVTEELLAAGAPVTAHWVADRQTSMQLLNFGSECQKQEILPRIAAGVCYTAIGMSEPQAGSDLAAVRTRAERTSSGWRLNGMKLWSSCAHISDYMIVLARTCPADGRDRSVGLSQFLVPLKLPGVTVTGIRDICGSSHFNETHFVDVELEEDALLGFEGEGWRQVMGELAFERSGPERYLSTFVAFCAVMNAVGDRLDANGHAIVGRVITHLQTLRGMSKSIASLLQQKLNPAIEAAMVKLMGNGFENNLIGDMRALLLAIPPEARDQSILDLIDESQMRAPSFTLRGGTTEILRGIVARQLGVR
jgi:alkylation response protein AidB-like acyl-CoA dehydrogenase